MFLSCIPYGSVAVAVAIAGLLLPGISSPWKSLDDSHIITINETTLGVPGSSAGLQASP